jgi:hypothetical protein
MARSARLEETTNFFSSPAGGLLCPSCSAKASAARPVSVNAIELLRFLRANEYTKIRKLRLDSDLAKELEQQLQEYITYVLEHEVRSANWLRRLREHEPIARLLAAQENPR